MLAGDYGGVRREQCYVPREQKFAEELGPPDTLRHNASVTRPSQFVTRHANATWFSLVRAGQKITRVCALRLNKLKRFTASLKVLRSPRDVWVGVEPTSVALHGLGVPVPSNTPHRAPHSPTSIPLKIPPTRYRSLLITCRLVSLAHCSLVPSDFPDTNHHTPKNQAPCTIACMSQRLSTSSRSSLRHIPQSPTNAPLSHFHRHARPSTLLH